jgi:uncharacterized protein (DUF849 family)
MTSLAAPVVLAPTGAVPTKKHTPHVPLQPKEIAADVARAAEIGITAVHLHARDTDGAPTWDRDIFADIITRIRESTPDVVINVSTSGRTWSELVHRSDVLNLTGDVKPDLASLTLSSMNFMDGPSINSPTMIRDLARLMRDRGITPELEIFDIGMLNFAKVLRHEGLLPGVIPANLFFGNIAGMQASLGEMGLATSLLPDFMRWSGAGIGRFQNTAQAIALNAGGGVRVGLEDGIYLDGARTTLATNASLVERVHSLLDLAERSIMTPATYRTEILGQ